MSEKFGKSFGDIIIDKIGIEKVKRSTFDHAVVVGHYLLDYLIIWAVIAMSILNINPPLNIYLPFIAIRGASALLFVIVRHPLFFMINKLTILAEIMTVKELNTMYSAFVFLP